MASIEDVGNALVSMIEPIVYPNTTDNPSIANVDISMFFGWPLPQVLEDVVVKNGNIIVSVYPNAMEKNTNRGLGNNWEECTLSEDSLSGIVVKETKRQEKMFQISIWANSPTLRNTVLTAIDSEFSDIYRIDSVQGNMSYVRTAYLDDLEKEGLYRGELFYQVEFPTTKIQTVDVIQHTGITVSDWDEELTVTRTT